MARVKRGTIAHKRRKRVLKQTRGFKWGRKSKYRLAKQALLKAYSYAYRDRRVKKRKARQLWQVQINAACRKHNISYSKFMAKLKQNKIELDRKILAQLARQRPETFNQLIETIKA